MQAISTSNLYSTTVGQALNVQTQWSVAETQQASGLQAQDFGTLGGGSSREMLNFETDINQASNWSSVAKTVGTTTQAMFTAVGTMQQDVNKLQTLISTAMSSPNNSDLLGQATSIMATLLTQVNQQVGGNYLFAGSNTSVAPVNLTHYPTLAVGTDPSTGNPTYTYDTSTADTSYYTGDTNIASAQVNLQQTISYGVLASNPAMEESIRAIQTVIEAAQVSTVSSVTATSPDAATSVAGGPASLSINGQTFDITGGASLDQIASQINGQANGSGVSASVVPDTQGNYHLRISNGQGAISIDSGLDGGLGLSNASPLPAATLTNTLKSSLTITNQAVADLGNLQETISNVSNTLNNAQQTQTSFVTFLQNSLSGVKDVDTAQAAAQVQQFQTQLQASFLAVSTLTKLSLASFL